MTQRARTLLVLGLLIAAGCDRVDVRLSESPPTMSDPAAASVAFNLRPAYFESLGERLPSLLGEAASLPWSGGTLDETLPDGTEMTLGPLEASWQLQTMSLSPQEGAVMVAARFAAEPIRCSVRLRLGGETTICRIDLQLGERALDFRMRPQVNNGAPQWLGEAVASMTPLGGFFWTEAETCPEDLSELDWEEIAARIDTLLASQAVSSFVPTLTSLLGAGIGLPQGGLLATQRERALFFDPANLRIGTRVSAIPPWSGPAFSVNAVQGVLLGLDVELGSSPAACVDGLASGEAPTVAPLLGGDGGSRTPSGADYDFVMVVSAQLLENLLREIVLSGQTCADRSLDGNGLLPLRSEIPSASALLPELASVSGFDFGRGGRVRVQPLSLPQLASAQGVRLGVAALGLRFDLYGESKELLVRVASLELEAALELELGIRDGELHASLAELSLDEIEGSSPLLERAGVELPSERVVGDLLQGLLSQVALPLPSPFGLELALVEMAERDGAVWFYLALGE